MKNKELMEQLAQKDPEAEIKIMGEGFNDTAIGTVSNLGFGEGVVFLITNDIFDDPDEDE